MKLNSVLARLLVRFKWQTHVVKTESRPLKWTKRVLLLAGKWRAKYMLHISHFIDKQCPELNEHWTKRRRDRNARRTRREWAEGIELVSINVVPLQKYKKREVQVIFFENHQASFKITHENWNLNFLHLLLTCCSVFNCSNCCLRC
jgi:hypothetical protein